MEGGGPSLPKTTSSSQSQHQVEDGATQYLVISCCLLIVHLFTTVDEPLLLWGNSLFLLHTLFDSLHLVCGFNVNLNLLSRQRLHFN